MKTQVLNPYLPSWEYVPDGEPHVFGDRLYIFGSHDRLHGKKFCLNDYVGWSAPLNDLSDWRCDGTIYKRTQHPGNEEGKRTLYAPDVAQGPDGRYYLYYGLAEDMQLAVAVCDTPTGEYEFYGFVHDKNGISWGQRPGDFMPFDPAILVDDDGSIHLYAGQGPMFRRKMNREYKNHTRNTAWHVQLESDMLTMKAEPQPLIPSLLNSAGTSFEGHEIFEASSIRKFNGRYYFIYSSVLSHELVYAVSDRPDRDFIYQGTLTSNGDIGLDDTPKDKRGRPIPRYYIGNNHGSVEQVNGQYYVFGHRQTDRSMCSRQGYADPITMTADGRFLQAERTSSGLNGNPLSGVGTYEARIACQLYAKNGATYSMFVVQNRKHPSITQDGEDRECAPGQYIGNMTSGSTACYKSFSLGQAKQIGITVRGKGQGTMRVMDAASNGNLLASIPITAGKEWHACYATFTANHGVFPLYFRFEGKGAVDFLDFTLE